MGYYDLNWTLHALLALSLAMPIYAYVVFPGFLYILTRWKHERFISSTASQPTITLLISAYNEAGVIRGKTENSLALEYPRELLQIIIVDDGSNDGTDAIVREFEGEGVVHHRVEGRGGKNVAINDAWRQVTGEIVVFSDANSLYRPDAIRHLVAHFADARVGCVCGELRYVDPTTGTARGEDLYWKYEQYLKRLESRMGQVLVLNGSIFAIRRECFRELHPRIANDFQIPVNVASQDFAIVYEPDAVAVEKPAASARDEFNRKTRIIARGFQGFFHFFREFSGLRLFLLISHKFLRWIVWFALLVAFISNALLLEYPVYRVLFAGQVCFYLLALAGPFLAKARLRFLAIPFYFCMINIAAMVGFWKFITRRQKGAWEPPSSAR